MNVMMVEDRGVRWSLTFVMATEGAFQWGVFERRVMCVLHQIWLFG